MSGPQKTAIVTGASQGIGAGVVKAFVERCFNVVANSRKVTQSSVFRHDLTRPPQRENHMKGNCNTASDLEIRLEEFAAELTEAAYAVALQHGARDKWLDLQLELWKALKETVKKWEQESAQFSEVRFACDWA